MTERSPEDDSAQQEEWAAKCIRLIQQFTNGIAIPAEVMPRAAAIATSLMQSGGELGFLGARALACVIASNQPEKLQERYAMLVDVGAIDVMLAGALVRRDPLLNHSCAAGLFPFLLASPSKFSLVERIATHPGGHQIIVELAKAAETLPFAIEVINVALSSHRKWLLEKQRYLEHVALGRASLDRRWALLVGA